MERFKILTLNNISPAGLERFPREGYEFASDMQRPDAIMVRSFDLHETPIPDTVRAVGRAGVGVNNIPVDRLTRAGIPVFNAPGANANAVKELVLIGIFLAARNIYPAWEFVRGLAGDDEEIHRQVESGKKRFVGFELPGKTLGVVGLGSIGIKVANAALALGMKVVGHDTDMTVRRALQLSPEVEPTSSLEELLARSDIVTLHVPLVEATRHLIDGARIDRMRDGVTLLNFSRDGIVDDAAVSAAIKAGKIHGYVCDFPNRRLKSHERVIALPHLGASTTEAEENCAIIVADRLRAFLEEGNIENSVNFPDAVLPRNAGFRLAIVDENIPGMLGQISTALANAGLDTTDMLNESRGELAYTLADFEKPVPAGVLEEIAAIDGILSIRAL